jgi:hypothetical protein
VNLVGSAVALPTVPQQKSNQNAVSVGSRHQKLKRCRRTSQRKAAYSAATAPSNRMRGPDFVRARFCFRGRVALLPRGTVSFERDPDANGERLIWLAPNVLNRLPALRGPGERDSDAILRLVELDAKGHR